MEYHPRDDQKQNPFMKNVENKPELENNYQIKDYQSIMNNKNIDNSDFSTHSYDNIIDELIINDSEPSFLHQKVDSNPIKLAFSLGNGNFDTYNKSPYSSYTEPFYTKQAIPSIDTFIRGPLPPIFNNLTPAPSPYVGLLNQGSTCYMNSLLQALFHLPVFRRLVYEINDECISKNKPDSKNIPLNLKLLFARMQLKYGNKAVSTEDLTTSFGWDHPQTFMQHDVQEFSRVLLNNLEEKLKGTPLEYSIKYIFGGSYRTYIYTFSNSGELHEENYINNEFYDISLDVTSYQSNSPLKSGNKIQLIDDIYSAFDKYTEEEKLSGDNQYKSEESDKKDAFMKSMFMKLPRVLYLHLKRFQVNIQTNKSVKINSFFRFYKTINLTKYVADEILLEDLMETSGKSNNNLDDPQTDDPSIITSKLESISSPDYESEKYQYDLFGVLVHSGTSMSGHYIAYLRPTIGNNWYQFNDSMVTEVDEEKAIDENFGGINKTSSAYMLIYVKRTEEENLFHEIEDEAIPPEIIDRIKSENKSSNNTNSSSIQNKDDKVTFYLFNEETTIKKNSFSGKLSFACDRSYASELPVFKTNTLSALYKSVAAAFQIREDQIEMWQFYKEGLTDKLDHSNFSNFIKYSMNIFVFVKENDNDLNSEVEQNSQESLIDEFAEYKLYSFQDILNGNMTRSLILPIFVFIYCPLSNKPFYYLFSYEVDEKQSIFTFLAKAIKKKYAGARNVEIDYISKVMNVYIKKPNNSLISIPKNNQKTFDSIINRGDTVKSVILVITFDEWNRFEIPQAEKDSYAFDVYLSEKRQQDNTNNSMLFNYFDFVTLPNQKDMTVEQYFNFSNDLNLISINSFGDKIKVQFPNLLSFGDFKNFLKLIFNKEIQKMIHDNIGSADDSSINYDILVNSTEVIIFKESDVKPITEFKDSEQMLKILGLNDKILKVKFIDPSLLLADEQIASFLLLDIFISYDSIKVDDRVEEYVKNDSTVSDLIDLSDTKFFTKAKNKVIYSIRVLQLDSAGMKILRILDPIEKVSSLSNPIRIEKVICKDTNENNDLLINVSFSKKVTNDPFLIKYSDEMKISGLKKLIVKNVKIQKEYKYNHDIDDEEEGSNFLYIFSNEKGNKINQIENDVCIKEISPRLTEVFVDSKINPDRDIDGSVRLYN